MLFLKQSTSATVKIGPFLDSTDGNTQETLLTISQADVLLSKNGGALTQKTEATSCTHDAAGVYDCPIDATDTGTLGRLQLHVHESGALAVWHEFMVLPANVYNSLILGSASDYLDVAVVEQANIDFGATQKASINTEVDSALDTAIPGSPTANSVNERVKATDDKLPTNYLMGSSVQTAKDDEIDAIKAITDTLTLTAIADAVHDEAIEGTTTLRKAANIMLAALAGKSSGGGTATITFRDQADTKNRISATVDADGNRTAITNDGA